VFVVSVLNEEGKSVTAVGLADGRGAAEQHRDRLRSPDGWTAHVIRLREPITPTSSASSASTAAGSGSALALGTLAL